MPSRHSMGTCQENELARNSSGNIRPQSSRLAEPQWTDPVVSAIGASELFSTVLLLIFFNDNNKLEGGK